MPERPQRKYSFLEILAVCAAILFLAAVLVDYTTKRTDCDARGGVVVRTAFGFACVSGPSSPGHQP